LDYQSIKSAETETGLRLVLNAGVPGPWSEAAKALFSYHGVAYTPVAQLPGQENVELVAWTGHRNAPIAMWRDEPPRTRWLELLMLAERLGHNESLLPEDRRQRIQVLGWTHEIAGESGFGWCARQLIFASWASQLSEDEQRHHRMLTAYDFAAHDSRDMQQRATRFLVEFAEALESSEGPYLIGDRFSAADLYWAYFSNLLAPMDDQRNPMVPAARSSYEIPGQHLAGYAPEVLAHRDYMFEHHLQCPLDF
jgi:glutathione S-transferase